MTASKESTAPRPASQHRLSVSSSTAGPPARQSRTHAHSLSVGSINPNHRVSRRKSMSSTGANTAAIAAAVKGASGTAIESGGHSTRRVSKGGYRFQGPSSMGYPQSLPNNDALFPASFGAASGSAIVDGPPLETMPESGKISKSRIRRASEGSRLSKGESKKPSGGELKCDTCGKGYKHSSCLTKHLWEHTPEWKYTSKLLISKHQQVQLLEAASVLVTMNQDKLVEPMKTESDHSSLSPAASGSSEPRDEEMSSTDTTPPPQADEQTYSGSRSQYGQTKRYSGNSSAYSRSYQSSSVFSESAPNGLGYMSHYRQWSADGRPTTSGTSVSGGFYEEDEQADLAAAVGLLSCSYGTPKSGAMMLPPDIPPVPPLPERFLGQPVDGLSGSTINPTPDQHTTLHERYAAYREQRDVDMDQDQESNADDRDYDRHRGRMDDDEGVFGRMEE